MRKSELVQAIERLAKEYMRADLSVECECSQGYFVLALLKILDNKSKIAELHKEEFITVRDYINIQRPFTIERNNLRVYLRNHKNNVEFYNELNSKMMNNAIELATKEKLEELTAIYVIYSIIGQPGHDLVDFIDSRFSVKEYDEKGIDQIYTMLERFDGLEKKLLTSIKGQKEAVSQFVKGISESEFTMNSISKTAGIFLFAGPPGVGKTYLAETGAQILGYEFMRFDMSEYASKDSYCDLIGSNPVWKNASAGKLTGFIDSCNQKEKNAIVLFDEIEKAHISTIHVFLQILDAGRLTDAFTGKTVSFKSTYIIFTTNAGRGVYEGKTSVKRNKEVIIDALRKEINPETKEPYFPQAICSRFATGHVVMFNNLLPKDLIDIGVMELSQEIDLFEKQYRINVLRTNLYEVVRILLLGHIHDVDARKFKALCKEFFLENVMSLLSNASRDRMKDLLKKENQIEFYVSPEIEKMLDELTADYFSETQLLLACEDEAYLTSLDSMINGETDEYSIFSYTNYEIAKNAVLNGNMEVAFSVIVFPDMKSYSGKSYYYADKAPMNSSKTIEFKVLVSVIKTEFPDCAIITVIDKEDYENTNLVNELELLGVKKILVMSDELETADAILSYIDEYKFECLNRKIVRENKRVLFDTTTGVNEGHPAIRIGNYRLENIVWGDDVNDVIDSNRIPRISFDDVIGGESVKKEMHDFIEYLRKPRLYKRVRKSTPKGVLLYGPPGTGKTFLAKAMAHEARVPFFAYNGSSFVGPYTGSGPMAIREMYLKARKYAPAIIFIDEIDSIGRKRTGGDGNKSTEETLNMLLSEMDGFTSSDSEAVFLIAATNYEIDDKCEMSLDPALVRRFSRTIFIDLPKRDERIDFLKKSLSEISNSVTDSYLESIGERSIGLSFGILSNVVDLARRKAEGNILTNDILDDSLETILFGEKKQWNSDENERTAWHEAGHAFIEYIAGQVPEYITITARGNYGGYVMHNQDENKGNYTKKEIVYRIKTLLAGRAAEIVRYGKENGLSTGASQDIEQARQLIKRYIIDYAMDSDSAIVYVNRNDSIPQFLQDRASQLLNLYLNETITLIEEDKEKITQFVSVLLEKNRLVSEEISAFFE